MDCSGSTGTKSRTEVCITTINNILVRPYCATFPRLFFIVDPFYNSGLPEQTQENGTSLWLLLFILLLNWPWASKHWLKHYRLISSVISSPVVVASGSEASDRHSKVLNIHDTQCAKTQPAVYFDVLNAQPSITNIDSIVMPVSRQPLLRC